SDAEPAHRLLMESGYRPDIPLTPRQEAFYLAHGAMRNFVRRDGRMVVELHWRLAQRYLLFALPFDELWRRRTVQPLGGRSIPDLAPEDLLIVLCAHGAKHRWSRLLWIADVAEFLWHERPDWEATLERARSMGCTRMVLVGATLAGSLLRAPLPDILAAGAATDPMVGTLRDQVTRRLWVPDHSAVAERVGFSMFYYRCRERIGDRLRYVWRSATTPNLQDWSALRLPPALSVLYYAFRPLRLIWKYGSEVVRG
ncbi:MAG: nucleotidyltransferase family protein, partial [Armatimonadota bacterium]|nr:nucleotidyltransferase family protein [Armatimonadota bacterium]